MPTMSLASQEVMLAALGVFAIVVLVLCALVIPISFILSVYQIEVKGIILSVIFVMLVLLLHRAYDGSNVTSLKTW